MCCLAPSYTSIHALLPEALMHKALDQRLAFSELVCYGIGRVGESSTAQHQLALLLALQHHWKASTIHINPETMHTSLEPACLPLVDWVCVGV